VAEGNVICQAEPLGSDPGS